MLSTTVRGALRLTWRPGSRQSGRPLSRRAARARSAGSPRYRLCRIRCGSRAALGSVADGSRNRGARSRRTTLSSRRTSSFCARWRSTRLRRQRDVVPLATRRVRDRLSEVVRSNSVLWAGPLRTGRYRETHSRIVVLAFGSALFCDFRSPKRQGTDFDAARRVGDRTIVDRPFRQAIAPPRSGSCRFRFHARSTEISAKGTQLAVASAEEATYVHATRGLPRRSSLPAPLLERRSMGFRQSRTTRAVGCTVVLAAVALADCDDAVCPSAPGRVAALEVLATLRAKRQKCANERKGGRRKSCQMVTSAVNPRTMR